MPQCLTSRAAALSLGLALLIATTAPSFAKSEKDFLSEAIQGDNSEILLGQLAASKGATEQVKSFAQVLLEDHSKHKMDAVVLADQMAMTAPAAATTEAVSEKSKLEKLSGAAFDDEFVAYMVKDHEKDIAEYKSQAESGEGPVEKLATKSLPTLEKHLHMARAIAKTGK